jgi:replicative DNA helicase
MTQLSSTLNEITQKEMIIISSILYDKDSNEYARYTKIPEQIFEDKLTKRVLTVFNGLSDSGIEPTYSILLDQIAPRGGKSKQQFDLLLKQLKIDFPPEGKEAIQIHLQSIKKAYKLSQYEDIFKDAMKIIEKQKETPLAIDIERVEKFIEKSLYDLEDQIGEEETKVMNLQEGFEYLLQKMKEAMTAKEEESVTSGYAELDSVLSGGFKKGTFSMIAARPGMGKTVVMLNMAIEAAKQGKRVLFLSLEMNLLQCFQRILAKLADVSGKKIQQPNFMNPQDWEKMNKAGKDITDLYEETFWIEEIVNLTVPQMEKKVKLYKKKHNIDIVYVDYAQIMLTKEGKEPNEQSDFAQISGALRRASKSQNVAIVVGSQLNRKVEERPNKRPMMSDIRNSGAFEQDAGVIIGLYRDAVYNEETDTPNILEMIFVKNRFGKANGILKFDYDLDKQGIYSQATGNFESTE